MPWIILRSHQVPQFKPSITPDSLSTITPFILCLSITKNDHSSVRILRPCPKVSPELTSPTLVSQPALVGRSVFGVALEILREEGQTACGVPFILRDMVEFLDKHGKDAAVVNFTRVCAK